MSDRPTSPLPTGSHPIEPKRKRAWWWLPLIALIAIVVLLLVLARCGGDDPDAADGGSADSSATSSPSAPTTTAATGSPVPTDPSNVGSDVASPGSTLGSTSSAASPSPSGGSLTAGSTTLLPMSGSTPAGDFAALAGQAVTARGVQVLTVPADEGFWVGTSQTDRVWVQLVGNGESPYQVQPGDLVDFTGAMVTHTGGFAARVGVDEQEGAAQLTEQTGHVAADRGSVMLSAG